MAEQEPIAPESVGEPNPASPVRRAVAAKWFFFAFGIVGILALIFVWRFFGGTSAGERIRAGTQFAELPESVPADPAAISPAVREAAEFREATQDIDVGDLMPNPIVIAEKEPEEEEFIEEVAVVEPPPEDPVIERPERPAGENGSGNMPEVFAPGLAAAEEDDAMPFVEAPQVEEPEPYVAEPAGNYGGEETARAVPGVVVVTADDPPDGAEDGNGAGVVPAGEATADSPPVPLKTYRWLGRTVFPWHSDAPTQSVIRVMSGPYQGRNLELRINKVGYQVAGAGTIGPCQVIAMRRDFKTPLFAPENLIAKASRAGRISMRHAFAGMSAAADAYAAWLSARAQPVQPIVQITDEAAEAAAQTGQPLVIESRSEAPRPDLGAVGAGGAAQSVARDLDANREVKVSLPEGHLVGLAAVCTGEPRNGG